MKRKLAKLVSWFGLNWRPRGMSPRPALKETGSGLAELPPVPGMTLPPGFRPVPTADIMRIVSDVQPFTMTSRERILALCRAVEYIVARRIDGDVVECGVWKGGSMLAVARMLVRLGETDRTLHLFDTFDGMTPPTDRDVDLFGSTAAELLAAQCKETSLIWAACDLEAVRAVMSASTYNTDRIRYVGGSVEETLPDDAPGSIALLRLDTDWYASTWHELVHLYPRLVPGGVLIIDDYGHWNGARDAVDEYFHQHDVRMQLHPIDYTGRIGIKRVDADRLE